MSEHKKGEPADIEWLLAGKLMLTRRDTLVKYHNGVQLEFFVESEKRWVYWHSNGIGPTLLYKAIETTAKPSPKLGFSAALWGHSNPFHSIAWIERADCHIWFDGTRWRTRKVGELEATLSLGPLDDRLYVRMDGKDWDDE